MGETEILRFEVSYVFISVQNSTYIHTTSQNGKRVICAEVRQF